MLAAARRHGLISYPLAPRFEDVLREIAAGTPVIVLQNLGDLAVRQLALRGCRRIRPRQRRAFPAFRRKGAAGTADGVHEFVWKKSDYWAMVACRPTGFPATAEESRWLASIAALERVGNARAAASPMRPSSSAGRKTSTLRSGLPTPTTPPGELKDAETVLRAALARQPDSVVVLNNLAQTLSDEGKNAEALALVERAVALGGPFASAVSETRELILKRIKR
jgi:hypothetical protein